MPTISKLVKDHIEQSLMLQECLLEGIVNYAALAENLKPKIEAGLGKDVKESAIMMALRRHAESLQEQKQEPLPVIRSSQIVLKTSLIDIAVSKSPALFQTLENIYTKMKYEEGDTFNIVHGDHEVSFVTNKKYQERILKILENEKILALQDNLVSLSMIMGKDFVETPGVIFAIVRKLAWENINLFEIISTSSELAFIIHKKDATRAYTALQSMVESS